MKKMKKMKNVKNVLLVSNVERGISGAGPTTSCAVPGVGYVVRKFELKWLKRPRRKKLWAYI